MRNQAIRLGRTAASLAIAMLLMVSANGFGATDGANRRIEEITHALLRLPYYGPFDALSFSYDNGTVTLAGEAYAMTLKSDAERAVERVPGVVKVVNNIEQLPASRMDDELRWRTFYAIYTNDFLSRYAPGGDLLWGHRDNFRWYRRTGLEPIGRYPIEIVVKNGHVRLIGMVDSEREKMAADIAARGVPGEFSVENEIEVHHTKPGSIVP